MMTTVTKRVAAYTHSEAEAWRDYLETTRSTHPFTYDEVEAWAWQRLQHQLKRLNGGVTKCQS